MTYRGHVKNGQIALDESVELPEGAEVQVSVLPAAKNEPGIWNALLDLAGTLEGLPPDLAENHDHYLYGTPKKK
ncbi:MAG TPA: hypothetical protein VFW73_09400 [Lacipirellulaceae bacterium]|nr:hypothetical protein [Lacipirellulaceae bacterium]